MSRITRLYITWSEYPRCIRAPPIKELRLVIRDGPKRANPPEIRELTYLCGGFSSLYLRCSQWDNESLKNRKESIPNCVGLMSASSTVR
ncbi:hypothetical protein AVEN_6489-1 [Araneus ventricosus]|uniref:Uncharacterized protein n=1 Tax=Araneus ventricosus TaxID=182803 RepID=A0A4Y2H9V8_ARAVE|nr:hypothetical protein AVEN_6489-1 [Araneus ventricosus]